MAVRPYLREGKGREKRIEENRNRKKEVKETNREKEKESREKWEIVRKRRKEEK